MTTILDTIVAAKKIEVANLKQIKTISDMEREELFAHQCYSLTHRLRNSTSGIIAEFKRKSPSKGWLHQNAVPTDVTKKYCIAGASGISMLTDADFFGGTNQDLITSRSMVNCPILRKDFIVDEFQIFEAKAIGADVVLLIAAALTPDILKRFAHRAKTLGMEVLLEIHDEDEIAYINQYVDIVGVNNRNLRTFEVNTDNSLHLINQIPDEFIKISESGISSVEKVWQLRNVGFDGFLMGENFMKEPQPAEALAQFIEELNG